MTKKEILNWIEEKRKNYPNELGVYENGYFDALNIIKDKLQQLPDDEWIRFDEKMPTEEDYRDFGMVLIMYKDDRGFDIHLMDSENVYKNKDYITHWKPTNLPAKPLPTKAEIMQQFNLSEEQLKEILK